MPIALYRYVGNHHQRFTLRRLRTSLLFCAGIVVGSATLVSTGGCAAGEFSSSQSCQGGKCDGVGTGIDILCYANLKHQGFVDAELEYLPHVVACENGAADNFEALKAQAVAARSYLYYVMRTEDRGLSDSEDDQVFSCKTQPSEIHYRAVRETYGEILRYRGTQVAAFYVSGAVQSPPSCSGAESENENRVTYNQGKSGDEITQTTLGYVEVSNYANRGCMSQNGSDCLASLGMSYREILAYYYGADIEFETAAGVCVDGGGDSVIGSACSSYSDCESLLGGQGGECLTWFDEKVEADFGMCTTSCTGECPQVPGQSQAMCIDMNYEEGTCAPAAGAENDHCAQIAGTVPKVMARFASEGNERELRAMCMPAATQAVRCSDDSGTCIDGNFMGCAGQISDGLCGGSPQFRCCHDGGFESQTSLDQDGDMAMSRP